jgi:hypothetical protein
MTSHCGTPKMFSGNAKLYDSCIVNTNINLSMIYDSSIDMNNRKITNVETPIEPLDAANKDYVDNSVHNLGINKIIVTLTDTDWTQISTQSNGVFQILVTSVVNFGPSGLFNISKSHTTKYPHIVRICSSPGDVSLEQLDLKWNPNEGIFLKKDGLNFNGEYNINLQNLSGTYVSPPDFEDLANQDYVDNLLLNLGISTQTIPLVQDFWVYISNFEKGTFIITINSLIPFGPMAIFNISKSDDSKYPHIIRTCSVPGSFTNEMLEVQWLPGHGFQIRKNNSGYDGNYLVKIQ